MLYGTRLRALSHRHRRRADRGRSRWSSSTRRWTPTRASSQKIFYVHVPLAIVALGGFVFGGICAIQYLRTRRPRATTCAPTSAIHLSLILGVGVLLTGSIWAKASWGHWWVWDEPTLVSFLIVFLLYATYQPLRFSIEDPERQARYAAVFAIIAGRVRPAELHRRAAGRAAASTRACSTRPAATCRAR